MSKLTRLDDVRFHVEPRTAQFLLSTFLNNTDIQSGPLEEVDARLRQVGIYRLYGDSFLQKGKVIMFNGKDYIEVSPLTNWLKQPYDGIPFSDMDSYILMTKGQTPQVFNMRQAKSTKEVILAPLDTIVYLLAENVKSGVARVPKEVVARAVMETADPKKAPTWYKQVIKAILDKVTIVGYRPLPNEQFADTYTSVMKYLEAGKPVRS